MNANCRSLRRAYSSYPSFIHVTPWRSFSSVVASRSIVPIDGARPVTNQLCQ